MTRSALRSFDNAAAKASAKLEYAFLFFVLGPLVDQRSASRCTLEDAAPPPDQSRSQRLDENPVRRRLNDGFGSVFDFKLLAKAKGDDNLPFFRKPHVLGFLGHSHTVSSRG